MTGKEFIQKTKTLLIGKQPFKERFATAFFPSLILTFILFLFGPLDLSHIAETYVSYSVPDVVVPCLILWAACFAVLCLAVWIPGGKLHAFLSSACTGLALAFYIQGNWLNIDLGALNGKQVQWENYGDNAIAGLGIFLLILLIPFVIHFYSRKIWKRFSVFVSLLLLVMQLVPLGSMLIKEYRNLPSPVHYVMKKDREFTVGKENIIVFILDQTAPIHIRWLQQGFPDGLAAFNDFSYYDNCNTVYMGTFPASAYLLTNYEYDWTIPIGEWFRRAWHSEGAEAFYSQMSAAGWNSRVYNLPNYAAWTLENEYGKIANVEKVEEAAPFTINRTVFRRLIKLSLYRYFPLIMKAPFWIYTGDLDAMKNLSEDEQAWDRIGSVEKYLDQRLSLDENEKAYITYHWQGAHDPYYINETGRRSLKTSIIQQLMGHFYVISEYIQQMKDYGVYDDSTIIITSDHGDFENPQAIFFIKPAGQRQREMTVSHAPISQQDFVETVAEAAGLEKGGFGTSVFDIPEDEERYRCTYIRWYDREVPLLPGKDTNIIQEYCYIGDGETINQMIENEEYNTYLLEDAWY